MQDSGDTFLSKLKITEQPEASRRSALSDRHYLSISTLVQVRVLRRGNCSIQVTEKWSRRQTFFNDSV